MDRFMNPKSVAVIGASEDPRKGGYALVSNLKEGLREHVYPICRIGYDPRLSFSGNGSRFADGFSLMDGSSESCGRVAGY